MRLAYLLLLITFSFSTHASNTIQVWSEYKNPLFQSFSQNTMPVLQKFVSENLAEKVKSQAVFYPFGGPDIIYPLTLFPSAYSYLLIGLEPRGLKEYDLSIPNNIDVQIESLLKRSFFISVDMSKTISHNQGVLPLFLAQLSLLKAEVTAINYEDYNFGKILEVHFLYKDQPKKLVYIRTNVIDDQIKEGLFNYIDDNKLFDTCMLKASSYSLHLDVFSKLRNYIISRAKYILQDDSGIPIKYLNGKFSFDLFGYYLKPYGVEWKGNYQDELNKMYNNTKNAPKIEFCFGYGCNKNPTAIILATRNPNDIH